MKALITGGQGFVGKYLAEELRENGYDVYLTSRKDADGAIRMDMTDEAAVYSALSALRPDCIFHLAGQASVPVSWEKPAFTYQTNVVGTLNLLEAVRKTGQQCRLLVVGSSDEYGKIAADEGRISETHILRPNKYRASYKRHFSSATRKPAGMPQ